MVYMRTVPHHFPETEGYAMGSVYHSAPAGTINGPQTEPPRLLDRLRFTLRAKHYAYRTEQAYVHWVRRFIPHHGKRHPKEMGGPAPLDKGEGNDRIEDTNHNTRKEQQ